MHTATSSAIDPGSRARLSPGQSECPCPGRSMAASGRSRASATVSQVWAFWPPPWRNTICGASDPHNRALTRRPGATSTHSRRTVGGPVQVRPASLAFSSNRENSS